MLRFWLCKGHIQRAPAHPVRRKRHSNITSQSPLILCTGKSTATSPLRARYNMLALSKASSAHACMQLLHLCWNASALSRAQGMHQDSLNMQDTSGRSMAMLCCT